MRYDKTAALLAAAALFAAASTLGCTVPQWEGSKKPAAEQSLSKEEAARRYARGRTLDRQGDEAGAFLAYLEAGTAGHGLAQKRLGEIYDRGGPVQRDYGEALRWYERARAQGIEVPSPTTFIKGH
jgi:TPR repeat protein